MPTENRSSNTELKKIVTEALVAMVSGVTGMRPPADAPLPDFIQGPVDQAAERIGTLLAQPAAQHQGEPVPPYLWVREENDCIEDYTRDPSLAEDWARDEWPITKPLYLHPPTSDGYSAGDMADQGAKAFAARDVEVEQLRQELLTARAQGRAEAVELIIALEAETGLDEFIGSHSIADTGDYGSHWKEDDLRQHFDVDSAAASELERCRYGEYQVIQLEEEAERLRTQMTTQRSWMDRFVEYCTESGVPEDLLSEYKAITAAKF